MKKKAIDSTVSAIAVVGILIALNVIGISLFGRADLTEDKRFTLSEASRDAVRSLETPVTVQAYFTKDLPPPYSTNARYVKDLLEEYYNASADNFRYEIVDPTGEETDADKEKKKDVKQDIFGRQVREATSMEKELQTLGIPPVQVRVNEDDKLEVKRAYMGIAGGDGAALSAVVHAVSNTSSQPRIRRRPAAVRSARRTGRRRRST
jgi:hypothetical protein